VGYSPFFPISDPSCAKRVQSSASVLASQAVLCVSACDCSPCRTGQLSVRRTHRFLVTLDFTNSENPELLPLRLPGEVRVVEITFDAKTHDAALIDQPRYLSDALNS